MHAAPKLAFDPVARFTRVAPDDEAQRASTRSFRTHGANQRRPQPRDRLMIEGIVPGLAADAISAEQLCG